jgi:hypothetical protein
LVPRTASLLIPRLAATSAQLSIQLIDVSLDRRVGALGERLVGVAIDLAVAGKHEGPGEACLCIGPALVDVHRHNADRTDLAGARHIEPIRRAPNRIGRR